MKHNLFFVKLGIFIILLVGANVVLQAFEPVFTNELALQQMQNYEYSNSGIMAYNYLRNYGWLSFVILAIAFFAKDAIALIKKLTNNTNASKGEQNYEEKDSE